MAVAPRSVTSQLRSNLRYFFGTVDLSEFAGGLNLRDAPTEVAANESPDLWNVTLDERGGVVKRLGYSRWNASAAANLVTFGFYSVLADLLFWYSKADGKLYSDPGTGVLTLRRTWTTGSRISMCDFAGAVYAVHPVDGLYSSTDGTTWTLVAASSGTVPKGDLCTSWQNKLWVAGDTANVTNLYFSAAGDASKWAAGDGGGSNNVREGDNGDAPIVALHGGAGFDQQSKPSLLVGKRESLHRVDDSSTGGYVTLDGAHGPASAKCMVSAYGRIYVLSKRGLFSTSGLSALEPLSQKLEPQFTDVALDYSKADQYAVGAAGGRVYASVTRTGAAGNDLQLEYHPLQAWFTARSDAASCYVTYTKSQETLLACAPATTGRVYKLNSGGSDDGAAIQSWFLTHVFEPHGGYQARVQRVRPFGSGAFTLSLLPDFATSGPQAAIAISNTGFTWDSTTWDDGTLGWGNTLVEGTAAWYPRQVGRAFQLRVDETSSTTRTGQKPLESGTAATVGAWALYGLTVDHGPLGLS